MKSTLYSLLVNAVSLFVADYLLNTTHSGLVGIFIATVVFGMLNTFVKPILQFFSLPLNFLSFGLFNIVLNGIILWILSAFVPDFKVGGFFSAILMGLIVSGMNALLQSVVKDR